MTDNARFVTTGVLDEAFFKENARYMLSAQFQRKRLILTIAINLLCIAECLWFHSLTFLWVLAFYWATYIPFTLWYRRSAAKTCIKRFKETYPEGKCELTTACTPEGVWCENRTSGGSGVIGYEHLHTMALAKGTYILLTKAAQYTVFFTDKLSEKEQDELWAYLLEKNPKLKIVK